MYFSNAVIVLTLAVFGAAAPVKRGNWTKPKRGLAWANPKHPEDIKLFKNVVSWTYNWAQNGDAYLSDGFRYVPMQWNGEGAANLAANVDKAKSNRVLAFNEPEFDSQANMSPAAAAKIWKKHVEPLRKKGVKLGAPAISAAPSGRPWFREFLKECNGGCHIDFMPIHWYGEGVGNFYDYIWSIYGEFGYNVWITEYASTSSDVKEVAKFAKDSVKYLDTLTWVKRYAWFGAFREESGSSYAMIDKNGKLNSVGKAYLS